MALARITDGTVRIADGRSGNGTRRLILCFGSGDSQSSFRADDHILEAVAGAVFDDFSAEFHDFPVCEHHLKPPHIVACDSVFDRAHSARIGADVAADGRGFFTRIRRIEQTVVFHIFADFHQQNARFKGQGHVLLVEFQKTVHAAEVDHDSAEQRDRSADQSGSLSARSNGNVVCRGVFHDGGNLFRRHRLDQYIRAAVHSGEFVVTVILADFRGGDDAFRSADRTQSVEIRIGKRFIGSGHGHTFAFCCLICSIRPGTIL